MAAQQQRMEIPAGGIADFAKTDEEISELEALEARQDFGQSGIANFSDVAGRMAGYGRFGDDSVAHVQTGELIVPKQLIDNNPRLRDQIFSELREAGIEDPEQYVVGSSVNRVNPDTGLMEFGFLSKLWKKLKGAVKKVVTVVLPIVLGSMFGAGGAALGSGIATLINGGDLKDALKSAAISGITAFGLQKIGIGQPGGSRGAAAREAAEAQAAESLLNNTPVAPTDGLGDQLSSAADVTGDALSLSSAGPDVATTQLASINNVGAADAFKAATSGVEQGVGFFGEQLPAGSNSPALTTGTSAKMQALRDGLPGPGPDYGLSKSLPSRGTDFASYEPASFASNVTDTGAQMVNAVGDGINSAKDIITGDNSVSNAFFRGGRTQGEAAEFLSDQAAERGQSFADAKRASFDKNPYSSSLTKEAKDLSVAQAFDRGYASAPQKLGLLTRYGPTAALGVAALAATGGFETPEDDNPDILERDEFGNLVTGATYIRRDPGKYMVNQLGNFELNTETGEYEDIRERKDSDNDPSNIAQASMVRDNPYLDTSRYGSVVRAAEGGAMYPRRNGGIMPYEGTANEDSVRALLMPGEFVMTTKAVRGAGNGSLNQGINNMYGIMRNLESKGRVA